MYTNTSPSAHQQNYVRLFKNHNNAIGFWEIWTEANGIYVAQYAKSLEGTIVRRSFKAEPKNVGRSNETLPVEQALSELNSKVKTKLDKGYVTSLQAANAPSTNALGLTQPMLATALEKVKNSSIDWNTTFVQPKLDGHRAMYQDGKFYSRSGQEYSLPHIENYINTSALKNLKLDGELYIHGMSLQDVSKIIKAPHSDEAKAKLQYHIYDSPDKKPFYQRMQDLTNAFYHYNNNWQGDIPLLLVETVAVDSLEALMTLHKTYRTAGYEGTMLRSSNQSYEDGKRSKNLIKVKEFHDAEFKIIGVKKGTPYITPKGTFNIPVWLCETPEGKEFNVLCQGDMHQRQYYWDNQEHYVGAKLTVKYHYLSKLGIPQLPIALRFHESF
tara:strand:- start:325 stop:1476 length:1152 start_codon:yes stop_codon:yes gene_type:complete